MYLTDQIQINETYGPRVYKTVKTYFLYRVGSSRYLANRVTTLSEYIALL